MEAENKKVRDAARKSYSEDVRSLAMWIKRRDPRVKEHELAAAAAAAAAEQKRKDEAAVKNAATAAAAAQRASARAAMLKEASIRFAARRCADCSGTGESNGVCAATSSSIWSAC